MKKRLTYEAPEAELILVRFEENLLASPNGESNLKFSTTPGGVNNPDYHEYGDDF